MAELNDELNESKLGSDDELDINNLGRSTLCNLGNSCYFNTALQSLFHILPLAEEIVRESDVLIGNEEASTEIDATASTIELSEISNSASVSASSSNIDTEQPDLMFLKSYVRLLEIFWEENCVISPDTFHGIFTDRFPNYIPYSQNDSSEALLYLIDHLHETLAQPNPQLVRLPRPTNKVESLHLLAEKQWADHFKNKTSPILKYLTGQEHQRLQCLNCNKISHKYVAFSHIALSIPSGENQTIVGGTKKMRIGHSGVFGTDLYKLFDRYCSKEQFDRDNQWECDSCNVRTQALHKSTFRKLSKYLIIVLKRFSQTMDGRYHKNNEWVNYPLVDLDLNKYITYATTKSPKYDLISVGCHQGIANYGHYYNFSQTPDGRFYLFNDEKHFLVQDLTDMITRNAYYLIYEQQLD